MAEKKGENLDALVKEKQAEEQSQRKEKKGS